MSQDEKVRHRYEHEAAEKKAARAEAVIEGEINSERLQVDSHAHEEGLPFIDAADRFVSALDVKEAYDLLPDFRDDELRRLRIVAAGVRLNQGDAFVDLRDRRRGALIATGEETVGQELLVPKNEVDYVMWDKLIGSSEFEPEVADSNARNEADPFPAEVAHVNPTYDSR